MKNLITVEWSESQKCFHVDDYETTLMNNMDSFVNGGGNDYQILFITDSREAAYDACNTLQVRKRRLSFMPISLEDEDSMLGVYRNKDGVRFDKREMVSKFDDKGGGHWEFYEEPKENKPAEVEKTHIFTLRDPFWMVFVDSQKIPQCKHDTYESAKEEAERLAKKSGAEVALIECVSIKKCKAVKKVEWEDI